MYILSVAELTEVIRAVLDTEPLLHDVWVRGEVSNLSRSASGHIYFTIKDAASQLKCVLFRQHQRYQSYQPINGALVVVHGRISIYEAAGSLQVYVDLVQADGIGAASLELEQRRQRLAAEGLFEPGRKRRLPAYPACIGVVTSAQGAVWHDIQHVVARRFPSAVLVLAAARVQGDGAPASIVAALRQLWELDCCDTIIVGRGGGSAEDLSAFNDERVVRAIFASPVPVISAVGHEVDYTLVDEVADVRAPTPSAAAELAVPDRLHLLTDVANLATRLRAGLAQQLADARGQTADYRRRVQWHSPRDRVRDGRQRVDDLSALLHERFSQRVERRRATLDALAGRLAALDPSAVLARGYAVVTRAETGAVVASRSAVAPGVVLRVQVSDGEFSATVARAEERGHGH
ncbi:MAG: exodeoxyribonuclease VII large subunit [Chloroflexi bacterium]|nr:exodeoxyribonuclease VII large subunit [Chloroflexota bacterium]